MKSNGAMTDQTENKTELIECPEPEYLVLFTENELPADERIALVNHLATCGECTRIVAELVKADSKYQLNVSKDISTEHKDSEENVERATPASDCFAGVTGSKIGRYVILDHLGSGGMGEVFAAFDPELDRRVALKLVHSDIMDDSESSAKIRLLREAQAMAKLSHPNVVAVHDVQSIDGDVAIAMEFIDGITLKDWIEEKKRTWTEIANVFIQAGEGLYAAHSCGLVHRDFKPENVFIRKDGNVFVGDFGLVAKLNDSTESPKVNGNYKNKIISKNSYIDKNLTKSGAFLGTPSYMSPEQYRNSEIDERSDQFSFCVALYEALNGKKPFSGDTLEELKQSISTKELNRKRNSGYPSSLHRVILRGLNKDPKKRFPNINVLVGRLNLILIANRKKTLISGTILFIIIISVSLSYIFSTGSRPSCNVLSTEFEAVNNKNNLSSIRDIFLRNKSGSNEQFLRYEKNIDSFINRWNKVFVSSCEDAHHNHLYSEDVFIKQVDCLRQQKLSLLALNRKVLEYSDDTVVRGAVKASLSLPRPSTCSAKNIISENEKTRYAQIKAEDSKELIRLKEDLVELDTLFHLGKHIDGLELSNRVIANADKNNELAIKAEALFHNGVFLEEMGKYKDSLDSLKQANWLAGFSDIDDIFARSFRQMAWVIGWRFNKPKEALKMFDLVNEDTYHRLTRLPERKAAYLLTLGMINCISENYTLAEKQILKSIKLYTNSLGTTHPTLLIAKGNLGVVYNKQGRYKKALEQYNTVISLSSTLFGSSHVTTGYALVEKGILQNFLSEYEGAIISLESGRAVLKNALSSNHPRIARADVALGDALFGINKPNDALEHYKKIYKYDCTGIADSCAEAYVGMADVYKKFSQIKKAKEFYKKTLDILYNHSGNKRTKERAITGLCSISNSSRCTHNNKRRSGNEGKN